MLLGLHVLACELFAVTISPAQGMPWLLHAVLVRTVDGLMIGSQHIEATRVYSLTL
jgi:hypothetical protein